jgi:hypothetical protein
MSIPSRSRSGGWNCRCNTRKMSSVVNPLPWHGIGRSFPWENRSKASLSCLSRVSGVGLPAVRLPSVNDGDPFEQSSGVSECQLLLQESNLRRLPGRLVFEHCDPDP